MGEYAEYILNGDDCQECGEHIGNGDGFPRSCRGCQSQNKKDDDFLAIRKIEHIEKLAAFLNEREYNFVKYKNMMDRVGQPMIGLMLTVPGEEGKRRGMIVCANEALRDQVLPIILAAKIEKGNLT
jgi:hypothetical protein